MIGLLFFGLLFFVYFVYRAIAHINRESEASIKAGDEFICVGKDYENQFYRELSYRVDSIGIVNNTEYVYYTVKYLLKGSGAIRSHKKSESIQNFRHYIYNGGVKRK